MQRTGETSVAIVDDDGSVRTALLGLMKAAGHAARAFASAEDFLAEGALDQISCPVADIGMTAMPGLALQARLSSLGSRVPIAFIIAHGDAATSAMALAEGALRVLQKPSNEHEQLDVIEAVARAGAGRP